MEVRSPKTEPTVPDGRERSAIISEESISKSSPVQLKVKTHVTQNQAKLHKSQVKSSQFKSRQVKT